MIKSKARERSASRRGLIAGAVFGITAALVAGAWAQTTFTKMTKGQAASAADVNKAHQDLASAIDKVLADPDCPRGYTKATTAPKGVTLCKKGSSAEFVGETRPGSG